MLLLAAVLASACADAPSSAGKVSFTWLGVAHWIVETPVGSLLLDAYTSRPPFTPAGPTTAGLELFRRIEVAVKPPPPVRWIFVGHSHFDHALDVGPIALATGAVVIGSRSTCFVAESQGLPPERCTAVAGGETLALDPRLEVRVVRVPHSSPDTIGRFEELSGPPASALAAPNGGNLGFLFRIAGGPSWFYSNSIAPIDAEDGSGVDFVGALSVAFDGVDPPDLWLGAPFGGASTLDPYLDRVRPQAFVPHHWDGLTPVVEDGPPGPFDPGDLAGDLTARGVALVAPETYLEKVEVDAHGVRLDPNLEVRTALGLH
jgi:L-ascorbate metabolism protein UlaG (beta-lactamase superfamily)